jgi:hypothetical protein
MPPSPPKKQKKYARGEKKLSKKAGAIIASLL